MFFYFTLKALFVLKIFVLNFCLDVLVMKENGLIRKVRLTWLARNCNINIAQYLNISKYNPTIKFGKLIEQNMTNIFIERSYTKCTGPFSKKSKFSLSLVQKSKILYSFFVVCQVEGYQKILKLSCRPLLLRHIKLA